MRTSRYILLFLSTVLFLLLCCTDFKNPFLDITSAKAEIVKTKRFKNQDTVLIFSKETLSVALYLQEHISKINVHIESNRFWKQSDSTIRRVNFLNNPIMLPFSFYDTGWKKIELTTYLNNDTLSDTCSLYVLSPLGQENITGLEGDTIFLKTKPVKDNVTYVWDLRDGTRPIKEANSEYMYVLKSSLSASVGQLYVYESDHRSPVVLFTLSPPPVKISSYKHIGTINADSVETVYTGDTNFVLKVQIAGARQLTKFTVDNSDFDRLSWSSNRNSVYLFKSYQLDTLNANDSIMVIVAATDKFDSTFIDTLYIRYVPGLEAVSPEMAIEIPSQVNDTVYVLDSRLSMYGSVTIHETYDTLYLSYFVNSFYVGYKTLLTLLADSTNWSYQLNLTSGWNTVEMKLLKNKKDTTSQVVPLAVRTLNVNFDVDAEDIESPKIRNVKVYDALILDPKKFTSSSESATLTMIVSDNKKVASVLVNDEAAIMQKDGLTYSIDLFPPHAVDSTNRFKIHAFDSAGNSSYDTISVVYNRAPQFVSASIPKKAQVGIEAMFYVKVVDPDNDTVLTTVTLRQSVGDIVLPIDNDSISWTPTIADTGTHKVIVSASDDYYASTDSIFSIKVYQPLDTLF